MKIFLTICLLLNSCFIFSQNINLTIDLLVPNPNDKEVLLESGEAILSSCYEDRIIDIGDELILSFEKLDTGYYELMVFPQSRFNQNYNIIRIDNRDTTLTGKINYFYHCPYDISENDKTCPKCHKNDKVIPIVYGFLAHTSESDEMDIHPGGCLTSGCDPNWHCKRDNTDF